MNTSIHRRSLLRGACASALLPFLGAQRLIAASGPPPKRLVFLNFGFGPSQNWYPTEPGSGYTLPEAMKPLERHRNRFSPISNLTNIKSSAVGSHWGATTFLTGADIHRTPGRAFHNSISCDQVAAAHIGKDVRFPALILSADRKELSGYGPGASLSWDVSGNPIYGEHDPVVIFSQLFGDGGVSLERRRYLLNRKRSVLDTVRSNAARLRGQVTTGDREKVDEYFSMIRGIEGKLARRESWLEVPKPKAPIREPSELVSGTAEVELTFDLMVAAMQTDSTRVITYRMPTNSLLKEFGKETGEKPIKAHSMTHYGTTKTVDWQQLVWRDKKLCSLFATFLDKMQAVREPDGSTLLDNTLVVMGSGLRTGHKRRNLPILLAGGGKDLRHGSHHVYKESETPLSNLWLSMLKYAGCPVDAFSESDAPLTEMFA